METETFAAWFNHFADFVKERPLLLLFDGHLTHISIPVIKRALDENITIVKFPPHLQMCCNLLTFPVSDLLNERGKEDFINA